MTNAVNIAQGGSNNVTMRNRFINGNMVINQRGASSYTATNGNSPVYTVDRWAMYESQASSKFSISPSSTAPAGFTSSIVATVTTGYTLGTSDYATIRQTIEGYNTADLNWGSANAKTVTLSFWVNSSVAGAFGGAFGSSSGANRWCPFVYTINSANTWQQITVVIPGDTSGTYATNNSASFFVQLCFGVGSTLVGGTTSTWSGSTYLAATGTNNQGIMTTTGNTFYITGVQLEAGTTASPFEYRQYGTELSLCQRYYETSYSYGVVAGTGLAAGWASSISSSSAPTQSNGTSFKVTKRSTPTIVLYNAVSGASGALYRVSDGSSVTGTVNYVGTNAIGYIDVPSSANGYYYHYTASAEL